MAEAIVGAIATALISAGVGSTAAGVIAAITVACPDDGWNVGVAPGQPENQKAAGWRALGAEPRHVKAVQAALDAAPEGVEVWGVTANDCLAPLIVEGDVIGTDRDLITPGSVAVFRRRPDTLALAKIYMGATWADGGPVAGFLSLRPSWVMRVPLNDLAELRRVASIWRDGAWIKPDTAAAIARAPALLSRGLHRVSFAPIGETVEPLQPAA